MMEGLFYYPFRFAHTFKNEDSSDPDLLCKRLYTFDSTKTHQTYWLWIEVYRDHFYAVKFHLKAHKDSARKYHLLTGLNEVRPVVNTCIMVMRKIAESDSVSISV